uniref:Uncharacterized protein n=1 Tax=Arion vulgaris TaxID=1028688 RepID=A0A0B6YS22_9EUPU
METTEMYFYRRRIRITWTVRVPNEEVLKVVKLLRKYIVNIKEASHYFFNI